MNKSKLFKIISVLLALLLWQIAAMAAGTELIFAPPLKVLARLLTIWKEPGFFSTVLFSLLRISAGFLLAFLVGTALGVLSGRFSAAEYLLWPYVTAAKTIPVATFIILLLIWMDTKALSVLIAFMIAFPVIYSNVLQGIRSIDGGMKEFAFVYRIPWRKQFVFLYLPAIKPYLISASSVAVGMAWKAGVAAEVIGIVDGSIGEMFYQAKLYFQNADLLCWTLVIILLSAVSEKLFCRLLKVVFRGVERL